MALGLTKKMALADPLAQIADAYFASVGAHPGWIPAWSGVFAFGMQVYFDFSGYSDMAIGMARLFGFHFPLNFRRPYLADSITEYWRRWHVTLSRWLRDYLYIPLGGNRRGRLILYRNLIITMLIGGFWHGAGWNRVLWGGYQGLLLVAERLPDGKAPQYRPRSPLFPLRWLVAFGLTLVGYAIFRAPSLADAGTVLRQMFTGAPGAQLLKPWHWGLVALALIAAVFEERHEWFDRLERGPQWAGALRSLTSGSRLPTPDSTLSPPAPASGTARCRTLPRPPPARAGPGPRCGRRPRRLPAPGRSPNRRPGSPPGCAR